MRDYYNKEISGDDIALAIESDKCRIVWQGMKPLGIVLDGLIPEGLAPCWVSEPTFEQACRVAGGEWDCIALPVTPENRDRVDESYRAEGRGSLDNVFGVDFNQQEE